MKIGRRIWAALCGAALLLAGCGGSSTASNSGALNITVVGLPAGVAASIAVSGPGSYSSTVTGSETLSSLAAGTYTVVATSVTTNGTLYQPNTVTQTISVAEGAGAVATVQYAPATGILQINITGLPNGTAAGVVLVDPAGDSTHLSVTTTVPSLPIGTYTVVAANVTAGGLSYQAVPGSQTAVVTGAATTTANVVYGVTSGSLQVTITGLPAGDTAAVTVTGPSDFSSFLNTSGTIANIRPGTYVVAAAGVVFNSVAYIPMTATQMVTVTAGLTTMVTVPYVVQPSTLVLTIDGVYITQAVQRYDFSVPLIKDRPGLLRVFLKANQNNNAVPDVRVRFYSNGVLQTTATIPAPVSSVPQTINEGNMTSSWNLPMAVNTIEPGMQILIDVDPNGAVPLSTRANLTYPANAVPGALDVRQSAAYDLTFVPVINSADGSTGDVTQTDYLTLVPGMLLLHPMWNYTAMVHAPVTFTGGRLEAQDQNGAWEGVLQEIETLRIAEGTSRYYYGVVHISYASGVAGEAFDIPAHSAVGYDLRANDPTQGASETYAHELGHDMGLFHAPGCGAAGPDPNYPYAGAVVGVYGYNVMSGNVTGLSNFDLMSYCSPIWISDYSYNRMITLDATPAMGQTSGAFGSVVAAANPGPQPTLLISGSIRGGHATINPVLAVTTRPVMPAAAGPYRLQGRDASGQQLFSFSFTPAASPDVPAPAPAHFNFAVPVAATAQLASLELSGPGIDTTITPASGAIMTDTALVRTTRVDASHVRLRWDATRYPLVLVRDAATGEVLSFARGGDVTVATRAAMLSLTASDRIRSRETRIRP